MIPPKYAFYSTLGVLIAHTTSVYTYSPRSNDPLTPEQADMLRESISDRQTILEAMLPVIEKNEKEISAQEAAISHLEATISVAERALSTQQSTLSSLQQLQENLEPVEYDLDWTIPSEVNKRCEITVADINTRLRLGAAGLLDSISRLKEYLPRLSTSIQEMKSEVSSRRFMQDALTTYITDTRKHRDTTARDIGIFGSLLNNVKNVPAEILAKIFSLRVHVDLMESMDSGGSTHTLYTAMKLSQVCRRWRSIICSVRSLWNFIPVYAFPDWPRGTLEYFKYSKSLASTIPALLCDCSQFPGRRVTTVEDKAISISEAYSLRVFATEKLQYWPERRSNPFRRPKLLELQLESEESQEILNDLLNAFYGYTSLEIRFKGDYQHTVTSPVDIPEELTCLKLDFTIAKSFDISQYLSQNLQELHISHDGSDALHFITTPLQLPRLEVLGVTPTDTSFTELGELPSLKKLVLYAPKRLAVPFPSLAPIADTTPFKTVLELELRDWSLYKKPDMSTWSIMTPLSDIVEKMRSVESLRCVDSGVQGSQLVEWVTALKGPTNMTGSRLESIFIDCCTGITRDQCDALSQMVQKLEIYV